jgi:hypothetical protein
MIKPTETLDFEPTEPVQKSEDVEIIDEYDSLN